MPGALWQLSLSWRAGCKLGEVLLAPVWDLGPRGTRLSCHLGRSSVPWGAPLLPVPVPRPLQVDKEKQQVTVEGGIFLSDLNVELSKHGLALAK